MGAELQVCDFGEGEKTMNLSLGWFFLVTWCLGVIIVAGFHIAVFILLGRAFPDAVVVYFSGSIIAMVTTLNEFERRQKEDKKQ